MLLREILERSIFVPWIVGWLARGERIEVNYRLDALLRILLVLLGRG